MATDITNQSVRSDIINEITAEENKQRKEDHLRRFEIYQERQRPFILERLKSEFSSQTVREMRTITSINLAKRIVDTQSSIYAGDPPDREFNGATGREEEQLQAIYSAAKVDTNFKKANRYFKLFKQACIQILPVNGKIDMRVLAPYHYDVIPSSKNPEIGEVYIVNLMDKNDTFSEIDANRDLTANPLGSRDQKFRNNLNERIGDQDDTKGKAGMYAWWSKDWNFLTNGQGQILDPDTMRPLTEGREDAMVNPIGMLPFIDISGDEKDFEYWVRTGNSTIEFAVDFGLLLSDISNISRLQGYSQAVISSVDVPTNMRVGPHEIMHLPLDPNAEVQPTFSFVNPNPDLQSSLELLETTLRLFLSSNGIDPKTVSGKADSQRFSSGVERLLSMIEKFEASRDDIEVFRDAEMQAFDLFKVWNNELQGTDNLDDEFQRGKIADDVALQVSYSGPEMIQTKREKQDALIEQMNAGLIAKWEVIAELRGVDEDRAKEIVAEIDGEGLSIEGLVDDE